MLLSSYYLDKLEQEGGTCIAFRVFGFKNLLYAEEFSALVVILDYLKSLLKGMDALCKFSFLIKETQHL